jgi:hypothetical protein
MSTQERTNGRTTRRLVVAALAALGLGVAAAASVAALALVGDGNGLKVSPPSIDFGEHAIGRPSAVQTVTVTSGGGQKIRRIELEGSDAVDFDVTDASTCDSGPLPEGRSCTLVVRFTATGTGHRTASVFVSGFSGGPGVRLAGTGVER